jgi:phosphatidylglycerophosphate synthase
MGFAETLREDRRLVRIPWEGMQLQPLRSVDEVPAVERAMLATARSVEDGPIVDRYVNRAVSWRLTRWLAQWCVTPNQVTAASLATGLIGAWLLRGEGMIGSLGGLLLYQLSVILDHADGELARVKFLQSPLGKWLDNISDHLVDLAMIGCLCWRVASQETAGYFATLGLAAAVGVTSAFLVVFWWSISTGRREVGKTLAARLLSRLLALLANRDAFAVALWATILVDRPAWFLWALALGANLYWVAWLLTFGLPPRNRLATDQPGG